MMAATSPSRSAIHYADAALILYRRAISPVRARELLQLQFIRNIGTAGRDNMYY